MTAFKTAHHTLSIIRKPAYSSSSDDRIVPKERYIPICSCGWRYTGGACKKKETAEQLGQAQHIEQVKKLCPTPGKRKYKDEAAATEDMLRFWSRPHSGKLMPCRVYECDCGRWHMTSKPKRGY